MATARITAPTSAGASEANRPESPVAYVWELPVRLAHWTIVVCIVVLGFTGFYLHRPYIQAAPDSRYLLATIRYIHEVAAFVFALALLVRIYWGFVGNRHARWRALLPLTREDWRRLGQTLQFYLFYRRRPPAVVGHNPLAGLTYLGLFIVLIAQMILGFALYSRLNPTGPWHTLFGWVFTIAPVQQVRMLHFLLLFLLIAFTIHHVYSAVLWDAERRSGLISSMITGFKRVAPEHPAERQFTPSTIGYWVHRIRSRSPTSEGD